MHEHEHDAVHAELLPQDRENSKAHGQSRFQLEELEPEVQKQPAREQSHSGHGDGVNAREQSPSGDNGGVTAHDVALIESICTKFGPAKAAEFARALQGMNGQTMETSRADADLATSRMNAELASSIRGLQDVVTKANDLGAKSMRVDTAIPHLDALNGIDIDTCSLTALMEEAEDFFGQGSSHVTPNGIYFDQLRCALKSTDAVTAEEQRDYKWRNKQLQQFFKLFLKDTMFCALPREAPKEDSIFCSGFTLDEHGCEIRLVDVESYSQGVWVFQKIVEAKTKTETKSLVLFKKGLNHLEMSKSLTLLMFKEKFNTAVHQRNMDFQLDKQVTPEELVEYFKDALPAKYNPIKAIMTSMVETGAKPEYLNDWAKYAAGMIRIVEEHFGVEQQSRGLQGNSGGIAPGGEPPCKFCPKYGEKCFCRLSEAERKAQIKKLFADRGPRGNSDGGKRTDEEAALREEKSKANQLQHVKCRGCKQNGHLQKHCPQAGTGNGAGHSFKTSSAALKSMTQEEFNSTFEPEEALRLVQMGRKHFNDTAVPHVERLQKGLREANNIEGNMAKMYVTNTETGETMAMDKFYDKEWTAPQEQSKEPGVVSFQGFMSAMHTGVDSSLRAEMPSSNTPLVEKANMDSGAEVSMFSETDEQQKTVMRPGHERKLPVGKYFVSGIDGGQCPLLSIGPADLNVEAEQADGREVRGIMVVGRACKVRGAKKNLINTYNLMWGSGTDKTETGLYVCLKHGTITDESTGLKVQLKQTGIIGQGTLFDIVFAGMHQKPVKRNGELAAATAVAVERKQTQQEGPVQQTLEASVGTGSVMQDVNGDNLDDKLEEALGKYAAVDTARMVEAMNSDDLQLHQQRKNEMSAVLVTLKGDPFNVFNRRRLLYLLRRMEKAKAEFKAAPADDRLRQALMPVSTLHRRHMDPVELERTVAVPDGGLVFTDDARLVMRKLCGTDKLVHDQPKVPAAEDALHDRLLQAEATHIDDDEERQSFY
jgi:hypothetical protein